MLASLLLWLSMSTLVFGTIPQPLPEGDSTTPGNVRAHDIQTFDGLDDFLCEGKRVGKPFRLETGDNKCSIVFYCTSESNLQVLRCPPGQAYDIEEMRCKTRASVNNCNMKIREELYIGWQCHRQPDGLEVCDDNVKEVTGYDKNLEGKYCKSEPCKNGGQCYGTGLCSCPWDYTGPHCEDGIDRTKHQHYSLDILEDGHHFKESIIVDQDDGIIIHQVPPHGHRIGMTFFVHNSTKLMLEVPTSKLNDIPGFEGYPCIIHRTKDMQTIEQLEKNMRQAKEYFQDPKYTDTAPLVINVTQIVSDEAVPKNLIPKSLIKYAPEGCDIRLSKGMETQGTNRTKSKLNSQPKEYYQLRDFIKEVLGKDKLDIYCKNNKDKCDETAVRQTPDCSNPIGIYPICYEEGAPSCQYGYVCSSNCRLRHVGYTRTICEPCCKQECQNVCPSYLKVCPPTQPRRHRG